MRKWLFNLAYLALGALLLPWFIFKAMTTGKYRAGIGQRLGSIHPREGEKPCIWIHAVSVGELLAARPLITALRERYPQLEIALTYTTKTAAAIAAREYPELHRSYSPLDLSWVVNKFFKLLRPRLIILIELELWPNWLMKARDSEVPVLLVNGRISEKSFKNYLRAGDLLGPAYGGVTHWGMQDGAYAERAAQLAGFAPQHRARVWLQTADDAWWMSGQELSLDARKAWSVYLADYLDAAARGEKSLRFNTPDPDRKAYGKPYQPLTFVDGKPHVHGVPMVPAPVSIAGNLKYDSLKSEIDAGQLRALRKLFSLPPGDQVLVCGSTHPGEHEALVPIFSRLTAQGVRVIIAPRHPERYADVRELLTDAGLPWCNRSDLNEDVQAAAGSIILLDTVGELATVYGLADVVFVGGSLIKHGGQNMAEPVALGKATLFGPNTDNFKETVRELIEVGGAVQVKDAGQLESEIVRLLGDDAARETLGKNGQARLLNSRGALGRYMELVDQLLA
ncbi:MAG: hypothetical protein IT462_08985 [Planctomycetes bacterium]|nr:hypothetical protein [Planctomycetota bacterium]